MYRERERDRERERLAYIRPLRRWPSFASPPARRTFIGAAGHHVITIIITIITITIIMIIITIIITIAVIMITNTDIMIDVPRACTCTTARGGEHYCSAHWRRRDHYYHYYHYHYYYHHDYNINNDNNNNNNFNNNNNKIASGLKQAFGGVPAGGVENGSGRQQPCFERSEVAMIYIYIYIYILIIIHV